MDFIFGWLAGTFLTWPAIAVISAFGLFCDYEESKEWIVFWTLVMTVIVLNFFSVTFNVFLTLVAAFIVVGCTWSFLKYKEYMADIRKTLKERVQEQLSHMCEGGRDNHYYEAKIKDIIEHTKIKTSPANSVSKISYWIVSWPFGFTKRIISSAFNILDILQKRVFGRVYAKIHESAFADIQ